MPACKRPPRDVVESDYQSMTVSQVAHKHGVGETAVRNWINYYGLEKKRPKVELVPGSKVGNWEVVKRAGVNRSGAVCWYVKCQCGRDGKKTTGHLLASVELGHACGCRKWTGAGRMPGKYWKGVMQKARVRGIEVTVTPQQAWEVFVSQGERCSLTGLVLAFGPEQTASLDRKDSTRGYTSENIQWVHKHINWMKNRFTNEYFVRCCQLVAQNQPSSAFESD